MKIITKITALAAVLLSITFYSCNNSATKEEGQKAEATIPAASITAMVVKHPVADYSKWLPVFLGHDSVRKAYGLSVIGYGRGTDDPNMVSIIMKVSDIQKAKEFAALPNLKETMQKGGVTGAPEITYINLVRNETAKTDQMNRMMIAHHVKDFNAWLKVFDGEGMAKRNEEGFSDRALGRGIEDTNMVYAVFAVNDMTKAKAAIASESKKKLMTDAGVDGPPQIYFYKLDVLNE